MPTARETLILFFKSPEIGKVKIRLAEDVGPAKALKIYLRLLEYTIEVCKDWKSLHQNRRVVFWGSGDPNFWQTLPFQPVRRQFGKDLGHRLQLALYEELKQAEKVLVIGSDAPQMCTHYLNQAFCQLSQCDAIFGPSLDGGFTCLGLKQLPPTSLTSLTWSSSKTLDQCQRRLEGFGLQVKKLSPLLDIDHLEDLKSTQYALDLI